VSSARRILTRLAVVLGLILVLVQLVPVERDNPPVETEVPATAEVRAILRRACYDCHSNETVWPWHTRIAPVSWLVARDVRKGREELNFSTWQRLAPRKQARLLEEVVEKVDDGEMPLPLYLFAHPEARLTAADRAKLADWAGP
jgi:hypothetical protein